MVRLAITLLTLWLTPLAFSQVIDKEVEANEVAVRNRKGEDLGKFSIEAITEKLLQEVATKQID